jgi:hypothetical protein
MYTLADIRNKTAYNPNAIPTVKQAVRSFASSLHKQYPIALTLTLKQHSSIKNANGVYIEKLQRSDCDRIAKRFTQKLNREVFGKRAAEKYGKKLNYFVVVEGQRSSKNLHLHLAIGNLPSHIALKQVDALVREAKMHVCEIDEQYKVDLADSGWMEYITKEVGTHDTDNVLWQLS